RHPRTLGDRRVRGRSPGMSGRRRPCASRGADRGRRCRCGKAPPGRRSRGQQRRDCGGPCAAPGRRGGAVRGGTLRATARKAAGVVAGSAAGGRAPGRAGARRRTALGFLAGACGLPVRAGLSPTGGYLSVAAGLAVLGLGTGFSGPAVTGTVLAAVPRHRAGMGSALNDAHQQPGIAVGVAVLGGLLTAAYRAGLPSAVPESADGSPAATLAYAAARSDAALAEAARTAFTAAQSATLLTAAGCAAAGALTAAVALRPGR